VNGHFAGFKTHCETTQAGLEVVYFADIGGVEVCLNEFLEFGFTISYTGVAHCRHCSVYLRKTYAGGYCFDCFSTLARCDLCVVSPDRCHFHLGTCREPSWGEDFCMQPHVVYLANTSGPKVGITRAGREHKRWMDQGASSALRFAQTPTRRAAGMLEAYLKRYVSDRTDWRSLVTGSCKTIDLTELRRQLMSSTSESLERVRQGQVEALTQGFLPVQESNEIRLLKDAHSTLIRYPVKANSPAVRLKLSASNIEFRGNLTGIVGQYLLFPSGVFSLSELVSIGVNFTIGSPFEGGSLDDEQMSLFS